jgi:hypothetical protein
MHTSVIMRWSTARHWLYVATLSAAVLMVCASVSGQEGHPLAGTWYGDYGSGAQRRDLTVIMKWDGRAVTGSINPGPTARPLTAVTMTITPGKPASERQSGSELGGQQSTQGVPPVFQVRIEVDGNVFEGTIQNPVAGNRRLTGTWTRGAERGTFQLRRL